MSVNIQVLRDMLAQDSQSLTQLHGLLEQERTMLESRQLQGMQELVAQKDQLLSSLAYNAKQREQVLRSAGLTTDLAGWENYLNQDASTRIFIPQWKHLTEKFIACQEANEINGKMINRSRQTLNHLLNLIRGQVVAPSLYTQKGATTNQNSSYTVAKA